MKKIYSLLLVLIMIFSSFSAAYATELEELQERNAEFEYTITVPSHIGPGNGGLVFVEGFWSSNKLLVVSTPEIITLKYNDQECDVGVYFNGIVQKGQDSNYIYAQETIEIENIEVAFGTWEGTISYTVHLIDDKTVPVEDELLKSQEELETKEEAESESESQDEPAEELEEPEEVPDENKEQPPAEEAIPPEGSEEEIESPVLPEEPSNEEVVTPEEIPQEQPEAPDEEVNEEEKTSPLLPDRDEIDMITFKVKRADSDEEWIGQAKIGMTWKDWLASELNNFEWLAQAWNEFFAIQTHLFTDDGSPVWVWNSEDTDYEDANNTIQPNAVYILR